jgi:hypothetical protein
MYLYRLQLLRAMKASLESTRARLLYPLLDAARMSRWSVENQGKQQLKIQSPYFAKCTDVFPHCAESTQIIQLQVQTTLWVDCPCGCGVLALRGGA